MKNAKQYKRAVDDLAGRVRKLLAESLPAIQQKYQLNDTVLKIVAHGGIATVAVELGKEFSELEAETTAVAGLLSDTEKQMDVQACEAIS